MANKTEKKAFTWVENCVLLSHFNWFLFPESLDMENCVIVQIPKSLKKISSKTSRSIIFAHN